LVNLHDDKHDDDDDHDDVVSPTDCHQSLQDSTPAAICTTHWSQVLQKKSEFAREKVPLY